MIAFATPQSHRSTRRRSRGPRSTVESIVEGLDATGVSQLARTLASTGQLEQLAGSAPFTLLAPSDAAIAELPADVFEQPALLRRLLAFHLIPGERIERSCLRGEPELATATGQRVRVELDHDGSIQIDGARLLRPDVRVGAGIVHTIDRVLIPAELDLLELLHLCDSFPRLLAALEVLELEDRLRGDSPHTLLVPRGLERLPTWEWHALLRPDARAELASWIDRHLVAGRVYLDPGARLRNQQGQTLVVTRSRGRRSVGGCEVAVADVEARNGLIHVIDGALDGALDGVLGA